MIRDSSGAEVDILHILPQPMDKDIMNNGNSNTRKMLSNVIRDIMVTEGIRFSESVVFAVQCIPTVEEADWREKYDKVKDDVIRNCNEYLVEYIQRRKPKIIITYGIEPLISLGIGKDNLRKYRGTRQDYRGIPVFPTYSPSYILARPGSINCLKTDVKKAYMFARDGCFDLPFVDNVLTSYSEASKSLSTLKELLDNSADKPLLVSYDTETTSLNVFSEDFKIIAVSYSYEPYVGNAFLLHHDENLMTGEEKKDITLQLAEVLSHPNIVLTTANGCFDLNGSTASGITNINLLWDCLVAEHLLDEDKSGEYNLKQLALDYYPGIGEYDKELDEAKEKIKNTMKEEHKLAKKDHLGNKVRDFIGTFSIMSLDERRAWVTKESTTLMKSSAGTTRLNKLWEYVSLPTADKKWDKVATTALFKGVLSSVEGTQTNIPLELADFTYEMFPVEMLLKYACKDASITRAITRLQIERFKEDIKETDYLFNKTGVEIHKDENHILYKLYRELVIPTTKALADIVYNGVTVNRTKILEYKEILERRSDEALAEVQGLLGREININSSVELVNYLYCELELPVLKLTATGSPSTDSDALALVLDTMPEGHVGRKVMAGIVRAKKLQKCVSTYLNNWYKLSEYDNKLHTNYKQNGTATGRLSSSAPNLQNVPFMIEDINLKSLFIPDSDEYDIYNVDIKAAEMRVLASYSGEAKLIQALKDGVDLHDQTAALLSGLSVDKIKEGKNITGSVEYDYRKLAKIINFGIVYGITAYGIARQCNMKLLIDKRRRESNLPPIDYSLLDEKEMLEVEITEGDRLIEDYFTVYPNIAKFYEFTSRYVLDNQLIVYKTGRKRRFSIRNYAYVSQRKIGRQGVNSVIQGSSSDIVMYNLVRLHEEIAKIGGRILLTVHDSIVFQVPKVNADKVAAILEQVIKVDTATQFPWMKVDWEYDYGVGSNYGEC